MTLLTEVMKRPLDAGYAEAAERKRVGTAPPLRYTLVPVLLIAVLLGLAVTWGVEALRNPGQGEAEARAVLEANTVKEYDRVQALSASEASLAAEVDALRREALAADPSAARAAQNLAAAAGAAAVSGPGLRVTLEQAQTEPGQGAPNDESRLHAGDLRVIVGALWQAGAEAISVGGVRLTSVTAIRDVGEVIQVELQPVASPYVIEAIGPGEAMELGLANGRAGDRIALLKGYLGAEVSISRVDGLELAAGTGVAALYYAQAAGTPSAGDGAASAGDGAASAAGEAAREEEVAG
ncbi:MAG: DUF881 domain-containing protein [Bifidobacteriaceae bacterium]|jgi:uncharacterized protein YlxW (UPF0749 family)|nr:DUF881 domain-containing protein [Bifidobacteriaceae bacterium]